MSQVSAGHFYWRFLVEIVRQTFKLGWGQIVALIIGLAILALQVHQARTVPATDFKADALTILWPYLVVIGAIIFVQIIRAPLALDRERAKEIDHLREAVPPPVAVTFERLDFTLVTQGSTRTDCSMSVTLRFSSGRESATLHNFRLSSELPSFKNFNYVAKHVYGHSPSHGSHVIALGPNDVRHARLVFDFGVTGKGLVELSDPKMAWCLEFEDASKRYTERIPEQLYAHA
jgi:hypothetical protein